MSRNNSSGRGWFVAFCVFGILFCFWGLIFPESLERVMSFFKKADNQTHQNNVQSNWIQIPDENGAHAFRKWQEWTSQNCQGNLGYIICGVGGRKIFFACDIQEIPSFNYLVDGDIEIFGNRIFSSIEFINGKFIRADCVEWIDGGPMKTDISEILKAH